MDLSALIFVALAVAWAVYLVPKALRHHEEDLRSRTVDRFSHTMRVLARREPVDKRSTELVTAGQPAAKAESNVATVTEAPVEATAAPSVETRRAPSPAARRAAARRATQRRRNVLGLILLAVVAVGGVAAFGAISWWYVAIPSGLLVAWLVACRIMVKGERQAMAPAARMPLEVPVESPGEAPAETPAAPKAAEPAGESAIDPMADTSVGMAAIVDPTLWDPVPVTLPTYVNKPAATRSVRTITFDDTGVWTSGRTESDAAIAREADEADKAARRARDEGDEHRAVGS